MQFPMYSQRISVEEGGHGVPTMDHTSTPDTIGAVAHSLYVHTLEVRYFDGFPWRIL